MRRYRFSLVAIFSVCLFFSATGHSARELTVTVLDQDFSIARYRADGEHLILWVAPGFESHTRSARMSETLALSGIEVWHVDLAESLFLPKSTSTLRGLDGRYVAALIEQAHRLSGKRITLLARSYSAIPVLRGARLWQLRQAQSGPGGRGQDEPGYLSGAILFSPELYSAVPDLGLDPLYVPIVSATNIPVMLYQAGNRGNRWQLGRVLDKLRQGGAQVYVKMLPGVTGLLYERDRSAATLETLQALPDELVKIVGLLDKTPTPLSAQALNAAPPAAARGLDTSLRPFKGRPFPLPLDLRDAKSGRVVRSEYQGKITVVNFWASWCPPCVEEIPSLNNLRELMQGKPFELISVNYAEDRQRVAEFLERVNVDFPVLLDEDGRVSAKWNVLVFPSTFVIGPDGRIAYGVNAAIHWDSPALVQQLNELMGR